MVCLVICKAWFIKRRDFIICVLAKAKQSVIYLQIIVRYVYFMVSLPREKWIYLYDNKCKLEFNMHLKNSKNFNF